MEFNKIFSIFGSREDDCDDDLKKTAFERINTHNRHLTQNVDISFMIQKPEFYLCYKIDVNDEDFLEVTMWDYLPDFWESIVVHDVVHLQPNETIFVKEVGLPYSLVIASFDTPVYATNYRIKTTTNVTYRLEGKSRVRPDIGLLMSHAGWQGQ